MTDEAYLGIDLGASCGRAVLGTLSHDRVAVQEIHRFANPPVLLNGTLHWDVLSLWREVLESLRICHRLGHTALAGVGVDTWGVDFGLIGRRGGLLANPICYRDRQTEGMDARIRGKIDDDSFYAMTGMTVTCIGTLPEIMALRERQPELLEAAGTMLWMPDLFRYFLSGARSTEPTVIGSSLFTSIADRDYSRRILETFGLPRSLLPPIARVASVAGTLLPEVREETGLTDAPVVVVAGHDTLSAFSSAPFADQSTLFVSSGTWSVVGVTREKPLLTPHAREKGFVNELGVDKLIFVRNLMGFYVIERLRRQWEAEGKSAKWPELERMAAASSPFAVMLDLEDGALFAPDDPEACVRGFLQRTGQNAQAGAGELVRGYLEGLALLYRRVLEDLEGLIGETIGRICLVGGGCRNALYCQYVADATGRELLAGPVEATSTGNILLQALAVGRLSGTGEIREVVRRSYPPVSYEPRERQVWDDAYGCYQELVARRRT